ncbi:MAG: hypothetical protein ACP5UD_08635 [Conexivisphaera sp.]
MKSFVAPSRHDIAPGAGTLVEGRLRPPSLPLGAQRRRAGEHYSLHGRG